MPTATTSAVVTATGGWKACLAPRASGGDYTISATCTGCTNTTPAVLEHVTFGDVWYCAGQSNMALPVVHTYSRNESRDAILAGKLDNIRIHGLDGNMNPFQPWATLKQAVAAAPSDDGAPSCVSMSFPSVRSTLMAAHFRTVLP